MNTRKNPTRVALVSLHFVAAMVLLLFALVISAASQDVAWLAIGAALVFLGITARQSFTVRRRT